MDEMILYTVRGVVAHGKHLGRHIGFRTVNLPLPEGGDVPENGVYAAELLIVQTGGKFIGVLNQGLHPTFPSGAPSVEMHLLDAQVDLYDKEVEIRYRKFLRPEKKFASAEELAAQIARDVEATRTLLRKD